MVAESDRGAVLVHVAFAFIALLAFSAFAVDYGVLWASRRQAQNAADAAALAGAVAFGFDSVNETTGGPAYQSAVAVVQAHRVWGQVPVADITVGVSACPTGVAGICVRADVYRDSAHGNPLPTFFGTLAGIMSQGVRATATANVAVANATDCLKPWAVIDKWYERYPVNPGTWTQASTFDKYITNGSNKGTPDPSINPPDAYVPPTSTDPGSGFHPFNVDRTRSADYGMQVNLKVGSQNDFQYTSGWFAPIMLRNDPGADVYREDIKGCVGITYQIGDDIPVSTQPGNMVGPTRQAVSTDADSIINKDPGAYFDVATGNILGSAFPVSPRIVPVPLVDADQIAEVNKGGRSTVTIVNIMGFFVEGYNQGSQSVTGRLVAIPGMKIGNGTPIGGQSAFLQAILLIR